jgi:hypothetical protein
MSERATDVQILTWRHQLTVLQRQLGGARLPFAPPDRAVLAALLHRLPRAVPQQIRLLARPDTLLGWHRDLIATHHARAWRPKRVGRARTVGSIRALVPRLARQKRSWE